MDRSLGELGKGTRRPALLVLFLLFALIGCGVTIAPGHECLFHTAACALPANAGTLALTAAQATVAESAGKIMVSVSRTGGSRGAVSATYATADGSAIAGKAYTAESGMLSWTDGDSATKSFSIPIVDQNLTSGSQTFSVNLSVPSGGALLGPPSTATITITDNDALPAASAGTLALTAAQATVAESAGNIMMSVSRTGGSSGAVSATYATADGSAVAGKAYTAESGTLSWADGDAATKSFSIPILDQNLTSGSQNLSVNLSAPRGGALLGPPSTATIAITDNDASPPTGAGTLAFTAAQDTVAESAGNVVISVGRMGGSSGAVSVGYTTTDGTGVAGKAYTGESGTLNWADGDTSFKNVTIPILDQNLTSGFQTFSVSLSSPVGGVQLGSPSTAAITITDGDTTGESKLEFSSAQYYGNGSTGMATLTVLRDGGGSGPVTVAYATKDNTAVAGTNYTAVSGTLSWAANDLNPRTIAVPISASPAYTNDATVGFSVILTAPTGQAVLGLPAQAIVTIGDPGTVVFAAAAYSTSETSGTVRLTLNRVGGDNGIVSVQYSTTDGTALAGTDYTAKTSTIRWNPTDNTAKTISIPILNAGATDGSRGFTVSLTNPGGGVAIGSPASASVTINDSSAGPGVLEFTQRSYVTQENAGDVLVGVRRSSGSTGAISVSYATANGTAIAGTDYTSTTGTLTWGDQDASVKTFTVPVADRGQWDGMTSSFTVTLSQPMGATLGPQVSSPVFIAENDMSAGVITLLSPSYTLTESSGSLDVTVQRLNGYNGPVSVNFATSDGTAHQQTEYTAAAGTLNWEDGDTSSRTITIPILDAGITGGGAHTLSVALSQPAGGATLGSVPTSTINIVDTDGQANACLSRPALASLGTGVSGPSGYSGDLSGDLAPIYPACSSGFQMYGTTISASGVTGNGTNDYFYGEYNPASPVRYDINIPPSANLSTLFDNTKGYCSPGGPYTISRETTANTPNFEVIAVPDANIMNNGVLNNYSQYHQDADYDCFGTQTVVIMTNPSPNGQIINNGVIGDYYAPDNAANPNAANYVTGQQAQGSIFVGSADGKNHTTITNTAKGVLGSANAIFTFGGSGVIYNYGQIYGQNDGVLSIYRQYNFDNAGMGLSPLGYAATHAYGTFQNYGYLLCNDYAILLDGDNGSAATYGGKLVPGASDFLGRPVYNGEVSCQVFPSHRTVTDPNRNSVDPVFLNGTGQTMNLVSRTIEGTVYLPVIVSEMVGGFPSGGRVNTLNFNFTGLSKPEYQTLLDAIDASQQQNDAGTFYTGNVTLRGIDYNWAGFAYVNLTGAPPQ